MMACCSEGHTLAHVTHASHVLTTTGHHIYNLARASSHACEDKTMGCSMECKVKSLVKLYNKPLMSGDQHDEGCCLCRRCSGGQHG